MAIARALIGQPRIMILDEATRYNLYFFLFVTYLSSSALDAESEYQVRKALERLLNDQSRTVLIIAHRCFILILLILFFFL